jgi:DNA-binding XRE family transcriptional regulator
MLFGKYMKNHRYNYGTMADALDVSRLTIANWDKGVTSPSVKKAIEICELLDIDFVVLLENAKEMKNEIRQS